MKRVIIYSSDFSLCYSLLVYLQNHYKIVATTDLDFINSFSLKNDFDAVFIDRELDSDLIKICEKIKSKDSDIPIFLTYVFNKKASILESKVKNYVDEIFYKPFDLNEISSKLTKLLGQTAYYE
ncbi:MAG: hypothetical protein NZM09_00635 [Ignavibacterium sp.]|nr:hypothetical protein [Ignavibacterium sp.]MCX7612271.1 hypothetical protein [Ignavibacterium sp.]MDW8374177.1 hypothetical protein [Ignavibacteriales bacterium]